LRGYASRAAEGAASHRDLLIILRSLGFLLRLE